MAFVVYTQIKELQIQEKEIYEFGNWLRGVSDNSMWGNEFEGQEEDVEIPLNADGVVMEYPWDDFSYIVVPDSDVDLKAALDMCESIGATNRFDIYDLSRTFFVVK
jgi:hypothetical protein